MGSRAPVQIQQPSGRHSIRRSKRCRSALVATSEEVSAIADPVIFQVDNGLLLFSVVDTAAPGYLPSWNAPGGKTVDTVTAADYDADSDTWSCQVTSGMLTPSADTTTTDVPATFCAAARTIPTPGQTSYTLDAEFLQDPTISTGLSRFLFEHDTEEAYFMLGLNGEDPPKAIGRVRVQAGAFGGAARTTLTATVSLPLSQKPSIEWGDATTSVITSFAEPAAETDDESSGEEVGEPVPAGAGATP